MTAPNLQPLAALLASHPSEVADALAWLVERSHARGVWHSAAEEQGLTSSFAALCGAEIALRGGSFYWLAEHIDGRAIARMGAAAWLHARLAGSPTPIERMSAAFDHLAAINVVADGLPPMERDAVEQARLRLFVALDGTAHAKRGIPEYGEDEVRERTGAQAPKGEQR